MEFGESARMIDEEILAMAHCLGCDSAEVYCQHAAIIVTLRRGEEFCVQMGKVGEHGVNLRGSEVVKDIVRRVSDGVVACSVGQTQLDNIQRTIPPIPFGWFVFARVWLAAHSGACSEPIGSLSSPSWLRRQPVGGYAALCWFEGRIFL
jgi:uncharacterized membrane protein YjjP (DUF1212 family)